MTPVNDDPYATFADTELDEQNLEAVAANAEQGVDMPQAIRHNLYIGWVLGAARDCSLALRYAGGNRLYIDGLPGDVVLVVPYPPAEWQP